MPQVLKTAICVVAAVFTIAANTALAADAPKPVAKTLITNARIFDGKSDKLTENMSVLVEGNKIAKIAKSITAPSDATVIDANGRTMTPGFIAAHEHLIGQMPFHDAMFFGSHVRPAIKLQMVVIEMDSKICRGTATWLR